MRSLFRSRTPEPPTVGPVGTAFPEIEGAEIAAQFAGNRVGGDFYDALRVSPERILFGMLDVAGRREENSGILDATQALFRKRGCQLFTREDLNESEAMTALCLELNRCIMETAGGVRSCPAFIACYHEQYGTLCYSNAGHIPGLLRDHAGVVELPSTGLPLGLFSHATADAPTVGLDKNAVLLLVSRGVVDSKCRDSKVDKLEFGLDRVKTHLLQDRSTTATEVCTSVLQSVSDFTCDPSSRGDQTALAFLRRP